MKLAYLVLLVCVSITNAQTPSSKRSTFLVSMKNFQKQEIEMRKVLNGIRVQDLQVNYAWGKQLDQYKDMASSQLDLLSQSTRTPAIGDDLAEEMLLLEEAQELNGAMMELSNFLSDPGITHDTTSAGKANTWARSITVANTQLSAFYTDAFHYVIWHARDVQTTNCAAKAN
ncbi:MAG TPA: hypothetical protein VFE38_08300 [Edaphobacter sp.]|nr:hypothetical protein [Edaphobacter sp.]